MKWIKRLIILFVVLLVVVIGALYLALDGIIKSIVQTQGTEQLHVKTSLNSVTLGLIHGTLNLDGMTIGSPEGFSAPEMMSMGKLDVDTGGVSRLHSQPIHLNSIVIDSPKLVIEQKGQKLNFRAFLDGLPENTTPAGKTQPQPSKSQQVKVIIDTLTITDAHVSLMSDIPGLSKPIDLSLPTMDMKDIGNSDGAQNGAAIKDVVTAVLAKLVDQSSKSGKLPINVAGLLSGNLSDVPDKLGQAGQKELNKLKIPVNIGGLLNQLSGKK